MRKSALLCLIYIGSLSFAYHFGKGFSLAVAISMSLIVITLWLLKKPFSFFGLLVCTFLIGVISINILTFRLDSLRESYDGENLKCEFKITSIVSDAKAYAKIKTVENKNQAPYFNVLCEFEKGVFFERGDVISGNLRFQAIQDTGEFSSVFYNVGNSTSLSATVKNPKLISSSRLQAFFNSAKSYSIYTLQKYLNKDYADLAKGLLLGYTQDLDAEYENMLKNLGIIHILAVSGLSFSILIAVLNFILKMLGVNKIACCIIVAVFSIFYMCITDFTPTVCRAGIMSFFVTFDYMIMRRPDKITTLAIAGAIMCFINPLTALNISFQLSFLATFGVVVGASYISEPLKLFMEDKPFEKPVCFILDNIALSSLALCFCFSTIAKSFGQVALLTFIGNLTCAPFAEVLAIISFLLIPVSILPPYAHILGLIGNGIGFIFNRLCDIFSYTPYNISVNSSVLVVMFSVLTAVIGIAFCLPIKRKKEALLLYVFGNALLSFVFTFLNL